MEEETPPFRGRIRDVSGRGTEGVTKGQPALSHIALDLDAGESVEASLFSAAPESLVHARGVAVIQPGEFAACPICLTNEATTDEHVPPGKFGGRKMTKTCARCNNRLGSRTEAHMLDWFDGAHRMRLTADGAKKPLTNDRVFIRETASGDHLLILDEPETHDDDLSRHLSSGGVGNASFISPREAEYQTGFLKAAFLAACLYLGNSRPTASAYEIADELLAARDAQRRSDVTLGPHARRLEFYRTGQPASGPTLAVTRVDGDEPRTLIALAGTMLVDWPFPELTPVSYGSTTT